MPSGTRTPTNMQVDIDPRIVAELTSKRDQLAAAYEQVAISLRAAAIACDEFQALLPIDFTLLPPNLLQQNTNPLLNNNNNNSNSNQEITIGGTSRKTRKPHVKDPNAPKKPNSPYILFSNEIRATTKTEFPSANQKEIVRQIGLKWKELSPEQKRIYEDRYSTDKERYDEELRSYRATQGNLESPPETSSNEESGDPSILATATIQPSNPNIISEIQLGEITTSLSTGSLTTTFSASEQTQPKYPDTDQPAFKSDPAPEFVTIPEFPSMNVETVPLDSINSVSSNKRGADDLEVALEDVGKQQHTNSEEIEENDPPKRRRMATRGKKIQELDQSQSGVFEIPDEPESQVIKKTRQRRNANNNANGNSAVNLAPEIGTNLRKRRGRNP
ncbi:hypothetical protein G9A89_011283 [Geosiphon pyriformis]|nr:hypothetical protein G9A89_011283 [Geosiphon pyriformis]